MKTATKILILEHDPNDVALIERELTKGKINYTAQVVGTRPQYETALHNYVPDIILSDYTFPSFDGPSAFKMKEELAPLTPFIYVSGTIGEENSIQLIKNGVTDFVLKDRLFTLPVKVTRALAEAKEKKEKIEAARALGLSESRLAKAQQIAQLGSWEVNFATNVTLWSEENCRIFGLKPDDNRQSLQSFLAFVHPDDLAYVTKITGDSLASLKNNAFYHRIIRKDGAVRYLHSESRFEFNEAGKPTGLSGVSHDITELKAMEAELLNSENNLRTIFENTDVGFLFLSPTYAVLAFNKISIQWASTVFGIAIQGHKNFRELLLPASRAGFDGFAGGILAGKAITYETSYPKPDGTLMWFTVGGKPVMDNGKVTGICIAITDITARKESEDKIGKISNLNAFIGQVNQNIVHIKDKRDLFKNACRIACEFGKFKIAWIGLFDEQNKTISLVDQTGLLESAIGLFTNVAYLPGGPQEILLHAGGYYICNDTQNDPTIKKWNEMWVKLGIGSCAMLAIKKGNKVIGTLNLYSTEAGFFDKEKIDLLIEVTRDISFALDMFEKAERQKEAEAIIARNEKQLAFDKSNLRALINNTNDLMWSVDRDYNLITANKPFNDMSLANFKRIIDPQSSVLSASYTPEMMSHYKQLYERAFAGESFTQTDHFEIPVELWAEISFYPIREGDKIIGSACNSRDVTERKNTQRKIKQSEVRFRQFFDSAPESIVVIDINTMTFPEFNGNALKLLKYSAEEMIKKGPADVSPAFQPDGRATEEKARDLITQALNGAHLVFEWMLLDGKGNEIISEVRLVALSSIDGPQVIANFADITARKEAEKEIQELNEHLEGRVQERTAELTESNKALEAFSYSVSHDLRAPVRAVNSFSKIILKEHGTNMEPDMKEMFGYIEESGKRMGAIIDDLLKLAKYGNEKLKIEQVNMTRLVNGVWLNISRTTPNHALLELAELPEVKVDMSMMQQVIVNLLTNAIKYSAKKEKPTVTIWCEQADGKITFYFKDNGAGFNMSNSDQLFGAFKRLHSAREFEGTGIGLTLVKRIIEKHGGTVGAEGVVGEGATFHFSLPMFRDL
jgi:PAS domain S-box-containing protein